MVIPIHIIRLMTGRIITSPVLPNGPLLQPHCNVPALHSVKPPRMKSSRQCFRKIPLIQYYLGKLLTALFSTSISVSTSFHTLLHLSTSSTFFYRLSFKSRRVYGKLIYDDDEPPFPISVSNLQKK